MFINAEMLSALCKNIQCFHTDTAVSGLSAVSPANPPVLYCRNMADSAERGPRQIPELWICFCTFTCCTLCALFVITHRFKCHCSLFVGSFCCHQTNKRAHCYSISGWKISMLLESFPPLLGVLKSTKLLTINYVPPWTPSGTNESIQFADCVPRWWTVPYIITTKQKKQKKKSRHGAHNGFCLVLGWLSPLVSWMRWSSFKAPRLNPA